VGLLLAACGGGGNSGTSASEYRVQLKKVAAQSAQAQAQVAAGLHAKTVSALQKRLDAFAASSQRIGDEVAKLAVPTNAKAANAELAKGEDDTASATRAAAVAVGKLKTPKAALAYLQQSLGNEKGAQELDAGLAKLKKLGYTTGS
jgi:hypothetical protein